MRCLQQRLSPVLWFGQCVGIVRFDCAFHFGVEFYRPVIGTVWMVPIDLPEIVDNVAAAEDQDSAFAEISNLAA